MRLITPPSCRETTGSEQAIVAAVEESDFSLFERC